MFGLYRFALAFMVVLAHLWPQLNTWTGIYAVFGFYALSGYLMALVIDRRYGHSLGGTTRFLFNRFLRLFPPYWVTMLLAYFVISAWPETSQSINRSLALPSDIGSWLSNWLLFGLNGEKQRLVPPAWSLDVELCFYIMMGLFLTRSKSIAKYWAWISVAVHVVLLVLDRDLADRYYPLLAASLPFSFGACIYHFKLGERFKHRKHLYWAPILFVLNATIAPDTNKTGFYLSLLSAGYLIMVLRQVDMKRVAPSLRKVDAFLGNLSYPVFLAHWPLAVLVIEMGWADEKGGWLLLCTMGPVLAASIFMHYVIEVPIEVLRRKVRRQD